MMMMMKLETWRTMNYTGIRCCIATVDRVHFEVDNAQPPAVKG